LSLVAHVRTLIVVDFVTWKHTTKKSYKIDINFEQKKKFKKTGVKGDLWVIRRLKFAF